MWEKKPVLFMVMATVVILIGTIVTGDWRNPFAEGDAIRQCIDRGQPQSPGYLIDSDGVVRSWSGYHGGFDAVLLTENPCATPGGYRIVGAKHHRTQRVANRCVGKDRGDPVSTEEPVSQLKDDAPALAQWSRRILDIDPDEIARNYPVALGLMADVKTFIGQMLVEHATSLGVEGPQLERPLVTGADHHLGRYDLQRGRRGLALGRFRRGPVGGQDDRDLPDTVERLRGIQPEAKVEATIRPRRCDPH